MNKSQIYVKVDTPEKCKEAYRILTENGESVFPYLREPLSNGEVNDIYKFLMLQRDAAWGRFTILDINDRTEITHSELEDILSGKEETQECVSIESLLDLLSMHGGKIVCTASLKPNEINQARAGKRMYVNQSSIGFVWMPPFESFPDTPDKVEQFEKWFPLDEELPDELKNPDWLYKGNENNSK